MPPERATARVGRLPFGTGFAGLLLSTGRYMPAWLPGRWPARILKPGRPFVYFLALSASVHVPSAVTSFTAYPPLLPRTYDRSSGRRSSPK